MLKPTKRDFSRRHHRARVIDASTESFVFELTGKPDKIDQFVVLMAPLGLVEVSRTGICAIARGAEEM